MPSKAAERRREHGRRPRRARASSGACSRSRRSPPVRSRRVPEVEAQRLPDVRRELLPSRAVESELSPPAPPACSSVSFRPRYSVPDRVAGEDAEQEEVKHEDKGQRRERAAGDLPGVTVVSLPLVGAATARDEPRYAGHGDQRDHDAGDQPGVAATVVAAPAARRRVADDATGTYSVRSSARCPRTAPAPVSAGCRMPARPSGPSGWPAGRPACRAAR